jgi:hypothetical protein
LKIEAYTVNKLGEGQTHLVANQGALGKTPVRVAAL